MILHIDFETFSACNLKTAGLYPYWEHPTTGIHCMGYCFDLEPVKVVDPKLYLPTRVEGHIATGGEIWAHNAPFEFQGLLWLHRHRAWPKPKLEQMVCTMAMGYALALPGSLGHLGAALALAEEKDQEGARIMLELCKPIPEVKVRKPRTSRK